MGNNGQAHLFTPEPTLIKWCARKKNNYNSDLVIPTLNSMLILYDYCSIVNRLVWVSMDLLCLLCKSYTKVIRELSEPRY